MTSSVLADLASAGFPVNSVSQLRTSGVRYGSAVPVLLAWLPRADTPFEKEHIVRALSVPWARDALGPLIEEFRAVPAPGDRRQDSLRWAIGNAIEVLWDDSRFDDLVDLARDGRFGKAREMIVLGLGRSGRPDAATVLVSLLADPVVDGHAVRALGKLRAPESRQGLERMALDDRAWVRTAAREGVVEARLSSGPLQRR